MSVETDSDTPNSKRLKRMKGGQKEVMCEEDLEHDVELKIGATEDMPDIDGSQDIPNDTSTVAQGSSCLKVDEMGEGSSKQLNFDGEGKKVDGGLKEMNLEHDVELKIGATQDMPDIDGSQDIPNYTSTVVAQGSSCLKVDEMGEGSSKQLNFDGEEKKVDEVGESDMTNYGDLASSAPRTVGKYNIVLKLFLIV